MRNYLLFSLVLLFVSYVYLNSQVKGPERIIGEYKGNQKKGLAHGKGKSVGKDTYEGEFKKGLPHGKGVYIFGEDIVIDGTEYKKGDKYEGTFIKGMFDGKGKITYADTKKAPKEGFWKDGEYIGLTAQGYSVLVKKNISRVECRYDGNARNDITIQGLNSIVEAGTKNIEFDGFSSYKDLPDEKFPMMIHIKGTVESTGARAELKVFLEKAGTWTIILSTDAIDFNN